MTKDGRVLLRCENIHKSFSIGRERREVLPAPPLRGVVVAPPRGVLAHPPLLRGVAAGDMRGIHPLFEPQSEYDQPATSRMGGGGEGAGPAGPMGEVIAMPGARESAAPALHAARKLSTPLVSE